MGTVQKIDEGVREGAVVVGRWVYPGSQAYTVRPTVQIKLVDDHYAVVANGFVVGTIERYISCGGWSLHMVDGSGIAGPVELNHAMQQAMRFKQP